MAWCTVVSMRIAGCDSCALPVAPSWQGGPERPAGCVHALQAKGGVGAACFVFHIGCGWAWQAMGCMVWCMAHQKKRMTSAATAAWLAWHGLTWMWVSNGMLDMACQLHHPLVPTAAIAPAPLSARTAARCGHACPPPSEARCRCLPAFRRTCWRLSPRQVAQVGEGFACMGRCIQRLVSAGVLLAACGWHLPPSGICRNPPCSTPHA